MTVRYGVDVTRTTQLSIETRTQPSGVLLALKGELDMASVSQLQRAIAGARRERPEAIVLDLRELDFIDSTGLRTLISEHEQAVAEGCKFALVQGSKQVDRLMSITRVAEHLRVISSPEEILV
jgi:anti-anti-sigma factor